MHVWMNEWSDTCLFRLPVPYDWSIQMYAVKNGRKS